MLRVEQALTRIAPHARPRAPRRTALGEAAGLVLAEQIVSTIHSPPHDKALMDGYAVMSGDRQPQRQVLEEIAAGGVPRRPLTPGTVSRIMTGAPLPEGADAVVAVEQTEAVDDHTVRLLQADPPPGQHMLPMGTSLRPGHVVLDPGCTLRPVEIGILAELGHAHVAAHRPPRVAVLPTGNELVNPGERLGPGQIRNSNGPMLRSAIERLGALAVMLPVARDEHGPLRSLVEQGLEADVLVLCGGVSAGKFDLVPEVLGELCVDQVFHKVALRPGKPLWFGVKQGDPPRLVFGLPGNPVSSLVCFELFVRPALSALGGRSFAGSPETTATLAHDFQHKGGRASCLPARRVVGPHHATPSVEILPWHGSADLATLARADSLARLAAETHHLAAGTPVRLIEL